MEIRIFGRSMDHLFKEEFLDKLSSLNDDEKSTLMGVLEDFEDAFKENSLTLKNEKEIARVERVFSYLFPKFASKAFLSAYQKKEQERKSLIKEMVWFELAPKKLTYTGYGFELGIEDGENGS